jgi:Tfp pilus assembly protein PilO
MSRRERFMLIAAIVLLGGIVFKFLIYDPQEAEHTTLLAARDAVASELARDEAIAARAPEARAEYARLSASIAMVELKLPQRKEIPALLTRMERFTGQVGMTFESIRPGQLTPVAAVAAPQAQTQPQAAAVRKPGAVVPASAGSPAYSSMPVDLTVSGTFAQTVAYLRGLRDFPRLIIVNAVSLTPEVLPKLGVTIHAQIYTLGGPPGQAGGAH